jgi:hypothetical protein
MYSNNPCRRVNKHSFTHDLTHVLLWNGSSLEKRKRVLISEWSIKRDNVVI